jgi:hypothetical protein
MLKKSIILISALFIAIQLFADNFEDVAAALKSGNAKQVSTFFNTNLALTIMNDEGTYSKQQAEVIMRNFFAQNPPKQVSIQHRGSSGQGAKYAVAIYECTNGKFRAYIFMKDAGNGLLIHELRIEKD